MSKLHSMTRLTDAQLKNKLNFINNYVNAYNAANGSTFDPNSNVITKNIATLNAELNKDINIQIKRALVYQNIEKYFNTATANLYIQQLEEHLIYAHDETSLLPYCAAVSIYPFIKDGLKAFSGESTAPKHLSSFNGGFINLVFQLAAMFAGAIATVGYLTAFDYYARKDYGENYLETNYDTIIQELQSVVYALNQPAAARNFQSVFWNISIFDKYYFNALFKNILFPDLSKPNWNTVNKLQKVFLTWFNKERHKALLTFPVVTVAMLHNNIELQDTEYEDFIANELSQGNSFFIYSSNTVDSLSSCCRLRNDISDKLNDFSYSLGAGGLKTGSVNVITINMNRFIQNIFKDKLEFDYRIFKIKIKELLDLLYKYQYATKQLFIDMEKKGLLPAYTNNFIGFEDQYVTIGINGLLEGAEYLGYTPTNNKEYLNFIGYVLSTIANYNKEASNKYKMKINTEYVPGENLGVKFAKWDKKDGYIVPRDCYNSYLYRVEDTELSCIDKLFIQGKDTIGFCDGGSACHLNLNEIPSKETFKKLMTIAVHTQCPYYCFNIKSTICNDCGYIDKRTLNKCSKCNSTNIDYATRVIGYLRRISNFTEDRQIEESKRYYEQC